MNLISLPGGILLAVLIAVFGTISSEWIGVSMLGFEKSPLSAIMLSILMGILIGNVTQAPITFRVGIQFCFKRVLRAGIILLGIRLSLADMARLGFNGLMVIIPCIIGALWLVNRLKSKFDVTERMATLIAVGTSICGTSAIVATGPAIDADQDEMAYAIANITLFGLAAMLFYPIIGHFIFSGNELGVGLFLGSAIHETAQVAGAGMIYAELFQSAAALDIATVTKLIRNTLMIVVIPFLAYQFHKQDSSRQSDIQISPLFPLFILGFIFMGGLRTMGDFTLQSQGSAFGLISGEDWLSTIALMKSSAKFLLATAMAAVGLNTNIGSLKKIGVKPFYLGFISALAVGGISLFIIKVFIV